MFFLSGAVVVVEVEEREEEGGGDLEAPEVKEPREKLENQFL